MTSFYPLVTMISNQGPAPALIMSMNSYLKTLLLLTAWVGLSARLMAAPGDLDVSFGNGGIVTTAFGSGNDYGYDMALQSDGKIVVAGQAADADFAVARYNPDGTLDTTFNGTGKVTTDFSGGVDSGNGVALQADGKIIVVGESTHGSRHDLALARYNTNGSLDTSFGQAGTGKIVTIVSTIGSGSIGVRVAVQTDGRIVVGGYAMFSNFDFFLVRYIADGTLDNTFGLGGLVNTDMSGTNEVLYGLVLQGDGKIVASGYDYAGRFQVGRYNTNGSLDSSFNGTGKGELVSGGGYGAVLMADGHIVVFGNSSDSNFKVVRYTANGTYDTSTTTAISFGSNGSNTGVVQGDGRIVAVGASFNGNTGSNDFALVRYNTDLSLDTGFHSTGIVTTHIGSSGASARGAAMQSDGRIVVAGYSSNGSKYIFTVARYQTFGNLVTSTPTHGSFTNNNRPMISGLADANATVNVYIDGTQIGSTSASTVGEWSFTLANALADGAHAVKAVNAADGSQTFSNTNSFTVDTVAPAAPVLQTPANGAFTNNIRPLISGTAEVNAMVTIYLDGTVSGTATASGTGAWSYAPAGALADGQHAVKANAKDSAGNIGVFSATNSFLSSNTTAGIPGDLDPSFGNGGIVTTAFGGGNDYCYDMVMQSDGKIVVAGQAADADFAVARYNPDGTLDITFNGTGKVTTDFSGNIDAISGVALQADGKIIAVGASTHGSRNDVALARYNTDGSLDTSFGQAGTGKIVTLVSTIGGGSIATRVAVQTDGRIVVGGYAMFSNFDFILVRYNADGTLDNTFGLGGLVSTDMSGTNEVLCGLVLQGDGKIVASGYDYAGRFQVGRYNTNGSLDTSFDGTGKGELVSGGGYGAALQADGRIIVFGNSGDPNFKIVRYSTNGVYDTSATTAISFGSNGSNCGVVQGDGRIVAVGSSFNGNTSAHDFALVRYNADLSLDTGFHSTGSVTTHIGSGDAVGQSVALQTDGRIVVAGYSYNGSKYVFTLARYFGSDQPPITKTGSASNVSKTAATLAGTANPNSLATTAHFEYGLTVSYGSVTADQACGNGTTAVSLSSAITGLAPNTTYHFRLVAMNAATLFGGTTYGADATFTTAADPPVAVTAAATTVSATAATLAGVVFPNGRVTSVYFDYGLTTTYTSSTSVQTIPAGTSAVNVFAAITGLVANGTYHFRVVANNAGTPFPIQGLDQTFVAQAPPPTVTLGAASSLTTTSVGLSGTVNGNSVDAQVFFDYGTDGVTFPFSVAATPVTVIGGSGVTPVSGSLVNLSQGVVYYYRLRAVSAGGQGISGVASFTLGIISGLNQTFPTAAPDAYGFALVTLTPAGILSGWRFVGEQSWRASGVPAVGLTTGDRNIEFRPVPGYIQPPQETVSIISGAAATVLTRDYFVAASSGSGGISVTLKPDSIATSTVAVATRAQWRFLGEDDTQWRDTGATVNGLAAGSYSVECKPVSGRATPTLATVIVSNGQTSAPTITYFFADAQTGTAPAGLTFDTVSTDTTKPYAYVGQIRSNAGSSTGFVVKARVVATAGHVVFDDGTLSAAQGLQWLFQRDRGTYEPKPQFPRGYYLFDGYTAQRTAENTPGTSSPQSQTLDVAAMYFLEDAGRGGFGGFLASDNTQNEFLISSANKMLVGYPVDGIATTSQGRMFATPPANVAFTAAFGRTYTTPDIHSFGGNSGGPLCVQYQGGNYYPAAIYLGGTAQTVVRSIDSAVIDLFNRADVSGNGGANNTGGGISQTSVTTIGSTSNPGSLAVTITPAAAVSAGGGWRLSPETSYRQSGAQKSGLSAGTYVLQLTSVPGYQAPTPQSVTVAGGQLTSITFTYAAALTAQETWRQTFFGVTTSTGNADDNADPDDDGMTNLAEFTAGTNPKDARDVFKVSTQQRSGGNFTLTTAGKSGRTYSLQRSTTLTPTSWFTVISQGPLGSDGTVTLTDFAAPTSTGFYRIQVTWP